MTVRELLVKIGARVDGFDQGLSTAERALDRWGDRLQSTGTKLTVGLTAPIAAAAFTVTKASIEFESAFKNVEKTVDGSVQEFALLKSGIREMAQEIPVSASALAEIAAIGGQFGVSTPALLGFTQTVADLSVSIDGISAEQAAAEMAQIAKVTGTAEGEFRNMGSALVALGNDGNSSEAAILEFTKRLSGAGTLIGLTAPQVMGIGAAMANLGINAESGGTAMSRVFSKMEAAVARGGDAVKGFAQVAGMSAKDFATTFQNEPMKAIEAFIGGLGRQKDAGKSLTLVLDDLEMKDARLTDSLKRLALSSGEITTQVNLSSKAWRENAALTTEAQKKYGSTENQLVLLKNRLNDAAITVGDVFARELNNSIGASDGFVGSLKGMAHWFAELNPSIQRAGIYAGLFLAAIGPTAWAVGGVIKGLSGLVGALSLVTSGYTWAAGAASVFAIRTGVDGAAGLISIGSKVFLVNASLALLVTALGWVAAAAAVAFGAWKIGEKIGEVTGLTDWIGKKMAGALYGVTAAEYDATRAASRHSDELKNQKKAADPAASALEDIKKQMAALGGASADLNSKLPTTRAQVTGLGADAGETSEELKKLNDQLSGREVLAEAVTWASAIDAIGGYTKLTADEQGRATGVLGDLIEKYRALGKTVPPILENLYAQMTALPDLELRIEANKADAAQEIAHLRDSMQAWLQSRPLTVQLLPSTTGVNLTSTLEPFKKAVTSALGKPGMFDTMFADLGATIKTQLGPTILGAFQGGGDVGKSVGGLIGGSLGTSLAKVAGPMLTKALGSTLGGALGSVIPGLGTMLGGLAGGAIGNAFGKLFGGARKEAEQLRAEFIKSAGGLDALKAKAEEAGFSLDRLLSTEKPAEFKAQVELLTRAWTDHEAQVKANEAAIAALTGQLKSTNGELGDLLTQASGMGVLPQALKDALQHLIDIGAVTPEVAAQFATLSGQTNVDFNKMREVAEKYGIDLNSLGSKFQGARLHDAASTIINDFDILTRGGADVGGVLFGMSEDISALVRDSIQFGTAIPANMQPWITELQRAGLLTDENGEKITDLSALKFGDPIKTQWETITTAMQAAADRLGEIADALAGIPGQKVINVVTKYSSEGSPSTDGGVVGGGGDETTSGGFGGIFDRNGDGRDENGYKFGTLGMTGSYWKNFGTETDTKLHGVEAVVTPSQAPGFAADVLGLDYGNATGSARESEAAFGGDLRRMSDELARDRRAMPRLMAKAVEEALLISGVGQRR